MGSWQRWSGSGLNNVRKMEESSASYSFSCPSLLYSKFQKTVSRKGTDLGSNLSVAIVWVPDWVE